MNPGGRKGSVVHASHNTPAVLLTYIVNFGKKNIFGDTGKKSAKKEKMHCHLRYGYFVAVTQMTKTTVDVLLR